MLQSLLSRAASASRSRAAFSARPSEVCRNRSRRETTDVSFASRAAAGRCNDRHSQPKPWRGAGPGLNTIDGAHAPCRGSGPAKALCTLRPGPARSPVEPRTIDPDETGIRRIDSVLKLISLARRHEMFYICTQRGLSTVFCGPSIVQLLAAQRTENGNGAATD